MLAQDDKEKQEEANAQAKEEVKEKKRERISNSLTAGVLQTEFRGASGRVWIYPV